MGDGRMSRRLVFKKGWCWSVALTLLSSPLSGQRVDSTFSGMDARVVGPSGTSGRIAAVDAWGTSASLIYAGAATGGLWKSTDSGTTWTPVFDSQPVSSIGAVRINPGNPDIVWVGTGEANPRNSMGSGRGVYRTLDGGMSWSFLGLEGTERISRILLHPDDPDVAWVAALGPAWHDSDDRGVFKTTDGGANWARILSGDQRTGIADLGRIHPTRTT